MAHHPKAVEPLAALPKIIGRDERGWVMIDVPAARNNTIFETTIGNKPLQLVAHTNHTMRVYVNPDPDITQPDEWESPAGSGNRMWIGSPLPKNPEKPEKPVKPLGKKKPEKPLGKKAIMATATATDAISHNDGTGQYDDNTGYEPHEASGEPRSSEPEKGNCAEHTCQHEYM